MMTSKDIVAVCETVLDAKRRGLGTVKVGGVAFPDLQWHGGGGWCQRNARKVHEAATGRRMPGAACCAYRTNLNLYAMHRAGNQNGVVEVVPNSGAPEMALPGDFLYFRGSPKCGTCGVGVGHVGIWLGDGRMFQHTSRAGLAITDAGPTASQRRRFCGAYRLLPLEEVVDPVDVEDADEPGQVWHIELIADATDLVAKGRATTWTDSTTRTGVPADTPGLVACSLPRALCPETKGSPFRGVPDFAVVRVYYPLTGRMAYCPVIDEGPAHRATAGTGEPGSAMVDLTPGAWHALGGRPGRNDEVIIRVLKDSTRMGMAMMGR